MVTNQIGPLVFPSSNERNLFKFSKVKNCQLTISRFDKAIIIGLNVNAQSRATCVSRRRYAPGLRMELTFSRILSYPSLLSRPDRLSFFSAS
jgi:hypothetical protein